MQFKNPSATPTNWFGTTTREEAATALRSKWETDDALHQGVGKAAAVAARISKLTGIDAADLDEAFGNNAGAIIAMAALADHLKDDEAAPQPPGVWMQTPSVSDRAQVSALERHPAYTDPKHPQHEQVSEAVRDWYADRFEGDELAK